MKYQIVCGRKDLRQKYLAGRAIWGWKVERAQQPEARLATSSNHFHQHQHDHQQHHQSLCHPCPRLDHVSSRVIAPRRAWQRTGWLPASAKVAFLRPLDRTSAHHIVDIIIAILIVDIITITTIMCSSSTKVALFRAMDKT